VVYEPQPDRYQDVNTLAHDLVTAFACKDWLDYVQALARPARRAQLQALAATWKKL
jgi:hypothetical protein